jgi:hypothetical protein
MALAAVRILSGALPETLQMWGFSWSGGAEIEQ